MGYYDYRSYLNTIIELLRQISNQITGISSLIDRIITEANLPIIRFCCVGILVMFFLKLFFSMKIR